MTKKKHESIDQQLIQLVEDIKKLPPEHGKAFIEGYMEWKRSREK